MAQLYKMTLYVCDLDGDLNLDTIKQTIDDGAFNGNVNNCITHFSDEKIGASVEWDDDIDLNKCNCTTEKWEAYFQDKQNHPAP